MEHMFVSTAGVGNIRPPSSVYLRGMMRKIVLIAALVGLAAAAGCQAWPGGAVPAPPGQNGNEAQERRAAIYAAVIRQLVTKDHTFGGGPSPFKRVFVADGVVHNAADPQVGRRPARPFSPAVKGMILRALRDLPPIRFVAEPDEVIVNCRVERGGALISLGAVREGRGDTVTVANGLFFGCLGGQWLTYVLVPVGEGWRVSGTKGPVAIS
jgi:hypothetical protein